MQNFPAAVLFVIVLSFLGRILKLTGDALDYTSEDFRKQDCNISLSSSAGLAQGKDFQFRTDYKP